jgi:hypothetical protein
MKLVKLMAPLHESDRKCMRVFSKKSGIAIGCFGLYVVPTFGIQAFHLLQLFLAVHFTGFLGQLNRDLMDW